MNRPTPQLPTRDLGPACRPFPSFIGAGFDILICSLSSYMEARVQELVESGAIEEGKFCGQSFIRSSDLIHYTCDDWEPT